MTTRSLGLSVLSVSAVAVLLLPAPGHAYVDPGTGSYALQMALAGFFALLFAGKSLWRSLSQRLRHGRNKTDDEQ